MNRRPDQLREIELTPNYLPANPTSLLYRCGGTIVLCTASIESSVPRWKVGSGTGWVTAEYNMLPGSTSPRKARERAKLDGRTTEIQRLIGRSLRSVVDFEKLGENTITVDCDVLQADGGTRTAAITGGFISLAKAIESIHPSSKIGDGPLRDTVAAISVGVVGGDVYLDLDYELDSNADVDMNVVMTGSGEFVELQGTGEKTTFGDRHLADLIAAAKSGIEALSRLQVQTIDSANA